MAADTETETVTVDAGEVECVGYDLLDIEGAAEAITDYAEQLREEIAIAFGGAGYEWRTKLPAEIRDIVDAIKWHSEAIADSAEYARRNVYKLAEGGS